MADVGGEINFVTGVYFDCRFLTHKMIRPAPMATSKKRPPTTPPAMAPIGAFFLGLMLLAGTVVVGDVFDDELATLPSPFAVLAAEAVSRKAGADLPPIVVLSSYNGVQERLSIWPMYVVSKGA